jgi:hypothetical protein
MRLLANENVPGAAVAALQAAGHDVVARRWILRRSELPAPRTSFIVNGATPAKNSALASAGAELKFANGVTLIGKFDGEFARGSQTYAGTGTLRVSW